ncbi:B-cell antigen receptor complex-associated protein alpha chain precursor [Ictalurus punctatus]|uniref:B-cell antigen receptor complex-associated protein alpha chain n=1 Tax=Ictalurus punctatus TaxID=7998 RepID=A1Z2P5_ICTPU|nr:B-cell antigen receptor complex-associated protein alpha chain precursor [Ictalurus punctatus]ABM53182.1 CD79a [Ictalurus punctatus]
MEARFVFLFCFLAAAANAATSPKIQLGFDVPSLRLAISQTASMSCCYTGIVRVPSQWIRLVMNSRNTTKRTSINETNARVKLDQGQRNKQHCEILILKDIVLNDTGLYQCVLTESNNTVFTPGTFLQVYVPVHMILNINERSKNSIITAEGVLLLLLVLIPGTMLICKSKGLNNIEKRMGREEENIYEGLNLDDCNSTYHQIQRSLVQGPYQDVINNDEDDIQLEKP